jgi:hypothetical protein
MQTDRQRQTDKQTDGQAKKIYAPDLLIRGHKKDIMIINHKSEVSFLNYQNIFYNTEYFEGF